MPSTSTGDGERRRRSALSTENHSIAESVVSNEKGDVIELKKELKIIFRNYIINLHFMKLAQ